MNGAHSGLLATLRALAFVVLTGTLLIPALFFWLTVDRIPPRLRRTWYRGCCAIFGLEIRIHGTPATSGAMLYVANHVSYLDILVLGAALNVPFVAKAEVARWPLFGMLARFGETMFIDRKAARSAEQRDLLAMRLGAGERLILFAEGTSSSGGRVLPFKSSLFGALERGGAGRAIRVQPVTVAYTRFRGGLTIVHAFRPLYAWYGDMTLLPHIWSALGLPGAEVEIRFHPPVLASDFASRKALARHAEQEVVSGLAAARVASIGTAAALIGSERPAV